jgi:hypothetical protein
MARLTITGEAKNSGAIIIGNGARVDLSIRGIDTTVTRTMGPSSTEAGTTTSLPDIIILASEDEL